jgi:hypothetical protein
MPKFIDHHPDLRLSPEAIEALSGDARSGRYDQFNARQLELFYNSDGKVFCLVEAPNEEAVRRRHEALGVPCGEVYRVESLL